MELVMQFGIFTVGDVTPDPTTGRTPTEHERIQAMTTIARKAEEVGLDVLATGEHHNEPFVQAPVYGNGPSLEDFSRETPLTVGSPQQVIDRTLGFRDYVGDYQRQLFLVDRAGLPLRTVLEQLDLLGEEVVPVLRKEFASLKPAHVPAALTHASLLAAQQEKLGAQQEEAVPA
jgi:luciferase-like monooxygenase